MLFQRRFFAMGGADPAQGHEGQTDEAGNGIIGQTGKDIQAQEQQAVEQVFFRPLGIKGPGAQAPGTVDAAVTAAQCHQLTIRGRMGGPRQGDHPGAGHAMHLGRQVGLLPGGVSHSTRPAEIGAFHIQAGAKSLQGRHRPGAELFLPVQLGAGDQHPLAGIRAQAQGPLLIYAQQGQRQHAP